MQYLCFFHQIKVLKEPRYAAAALAKSLQLGAYALDRCDLELARRCFGSAYEIAALHLSQSGGSRPISPSQFGQCSLQLSQTLLMLGEPEEADTHLRGAQKTLHSLQDCPDCSAALQGEIATVARELRQVQLQLLVEGATASVN